MESDYHNRRKAIMLYTIQRRLERFMIINMRKMPEDYSVNINGKIPRKVTVRNQARMGQICYYKWPKLTGGTKMQTIAFNSYLAT